MKATTKWAAGIIWDAIIIAVGFVLLFMVAGAMQPASANVWRTTHHFDDMEPERSYDSIYTISGGKMMFILCNRREKRFWYSLTFGKYAYIGSENKSRRLFAKYGNNPKINESFWFIHPTYPNMMQRQFDGFSEFSNANEKLTKAGRIRYRVYGHNQEYYDISFKTPTIEKVRSFERKCK